MIYMEINVNRFIDYLFAENEKQNLISRQAGREDVLSHIEDSLAVLNFISLEGKRVIDIGSGAGFPALVLAIYCPQTAFTLIEADLKKSSFLQASCDHLGLSNVQIVRARAEELGQDPLYRGQYDCCSSRAVAAMNVMLEYGIPLLKPGGQILLWKGKNVQSEVDLAQKALTILQAGVEAIYHYILTGNKDRAIVVVKKEADTPQQYPRRVGMPAKRPL
ncbi:MAG TPA: 16S rRNA (guanine(527)-N(7))-methyltransferase RsmG [Syntrophomonas sp.]|nr:16S rRNA (guanine(527)-N(7))-methyltransferase RsmG [Syntrophomonas sp.]